MKMTLNLVKNGYASAVRSLRLTVLLLFLAGFTSRAGDIRTAADLVNFAAACNAGASTSEWRNEEGIVCLGADIDMAKVKKFPGISAFGGTFDGCGHKFMNWKASSGLFHELLQGGVVRNLVIDSSCQMKATSRSGEYAVGFIADINCGSIFSCENRGRIVHRSSYADNVLWIGGIVGINYAMIYDCWNSGQISSQCSGSLQKPDKVAIRLGGIAGGFRHKLLPGAQVAASENSGSVSYSGDIPACRIGGITGDAYKAVVKGCVNRGSLNAESVAAEKTVEGLASNVGGIVGFTKGDVNSCDNFGSVTTEGIHPMMAGGICGMPHDGLTIVDCNNYGGICVTNEQPSSVGGLVGLMGRGTHIAGCINRGDVEFSGFSPDHASCVGGLAGNIYAKGDASDAAYLRNCTNYGTVTSGPCGNRYENHDRAIHTAGIAGRISGCASEDAVIKECVNRGQVKAVTGRTGNVAAFAKKVSVTGEAADDMAVGVSPLPDGTNVFGRIATPEGRPVPGVVVSDGFQCVRTDGWGKYQMKSDLTRTRFIFISIPAEYEIPTHNNIPLFWRRVERYEEAVQANFTLTPRAGVEEDYTVVMVGDPQMRGLGRDGSGERFRDVVLPDIVALADTVKGPVYSINLGDLVYNWMSGYDDYADIVEGGGVTMFNVIGNHDYDQNTMWETGLGTPFYETYISPAYYSFNIGWIHYVVVNDIMYDRTDPTARYGYGIDDDQMKWLEADLSYIPKDRTIVLCGHAQMFKKRGNTPNGSFSKYYVNYERYRDLLTSYRFVYSWSGHYHDNFGYDYRNNGHPDGISNVVSVTVARCNGQLRSNRELTAEGVPNGYMVCSVKGDDMSWYYKSVGRDASYQIRAYSPARTGDGYVKANIWNWTENFWGTPEWYENGQEVCDMEHHPEHDPDYEAIADSLGHLEGRAADYAKPTESQYMFRVVPSGKTREGEVRVKDNFGNLWTQKVVW